MKNIKKYFGLCWLCLALLVLFPDFLSAQTVVKVNNSTEKPAQLPVDTNVRIGKLANGFTYYIRHNVNPKNRVIFYLANKVGSVLENDDQQGLAHFMEHMNFNGTVHFPKNQLVDYLQKAGVRFGADINAYTSFDETVYQLPLPSDKPEILANGIQIMRDWAQNALLDPDEINKERGVVLEEKRLGKGAGQRMQQKYMPVLFNYSRYGQRLPIGLDTVLNNFKPETIRSFYHDWYRPDLQALIVVGDIDVNSMEKAIKEKFADLTNPGAERPSTRYNIPLTGANQFIAVTDVEQTNTGLQVLIKKQGHPIKTADDYKHYIITSLFNDMLRNRYSELSEKKDPPFIAGTAGISPFIGGLNTFSVRLAAKPGALEDGFKAVWRETERLKRFGFTPSEFSRAKKAYLKNLETSSKQLATRSSQLFVNEYLDNFLNANAIPGTEAEYKLAQGLMPQITLTEVNDLIKEYQTDKNRDIIITAPDAEKAALPGEAIVNSWIKDVAAEKLEPYKDEFSDKPLLSRQPISGKIVKETPLAAIHATELMLSNGAKVIIKPEKFIANDVLFKGFAPGGASLYPDKDYPSSNYAAYIVQMSGLGDFNFNELKKYLNGSTVIVSLGVTDNDTQVQGAAAPDELEKLLQMNYLFFTQPRKDTVAYNNIIAQAKAGLLNRKNSPASVFEDTVSAVMSNYNVRHTGPSIEKINQISFNRSYEIFKECFADASGFTFTFVGDFDPDKLKPLIEKYLASLPSTYQKKQAKDLGINPMPGKITKIVYKGIEPKATVRLNFNGLYQYSALNNMTMDALAEVLQIRLIERLREDESGVYSPSVSVGYHKIPSQRYSFNISFGCAPQNVDKLIASVLDEVNKLKTDGPLAVNLEKFKAESRSAHETKLRKIDFWSKYIQDQVSNSENLNEVNNYDENMQKITPASVKALADKYLSFDNFIKLILLPEKKVN
jgi:zinc protease